MAVKLMGWLQRDRKKKGTRGTKMGNGNGKYLDMLRDVFIILFLVFKGPVTGVTKMRKLGLFLFVLLWITKTCSQQIKHARHRHVRKIQCVPSCHGSVSHLDDARSQTDYL